MFFYIHIIKRVINSGFKFQLIAIRTIKTQEKKMMKKKRKLLLFEPITTSSTKTPPNKQKKERIKEVNPINKKMMRNREREIYK